MILGAPWGALGQTSGDLECLGILDTLFIVFTVFFSAHQAFSIVFTVFLYCFSRSGGLGAPWGGSGGSDLIAWWALRDALFSVVPLFLQCLIAWRLLFSRSVVFSR